MVSPIGQGSGAWIWSKLEDATRSLQGGSTRSSVADAVLNAVEDTVEISDEAKSLIGNFNTPYKYDASYSRAPTGASLIMTGENGQLYDAVTGKTLANTASLGSILETWDEEKQGSCQKLELVKGALDFLVPEKKSLKSLINKLGKDAGLSQSDINKMKIEVNSKGEIVVGGLDDSKKLARMEKALNGETGLASRLKNYKNAEMVLQRNTNYNGEKINDLINQTDGDGCGQWEESDDVQVERLGLEKAMFEAMESFYADETPSADFSYGIKGVANPEGALENFAGKMKTQLRGALNEYNIKNGLSGEDEVSLEGISFTLDSNGGLKINGEFSNNQLVESEVRSLVQKLIREEINGDEEGGQSLFQTAVSSLIRGHDAAFGEDSADGKRAVFEFGHGVLNDLYVDAPERKEELNVEATKMTAEFINSSVGASVSAEDFEISQSGRITYKGELSGDAKSDVVELLGDLQYAMDKIEGGEGAMFDESNAAFRTAKELVSLVSEYTSYGPGADNSYMADNRTLGEEAFLAEDTYRDFTSRYDYQHHSTESGEGKQKASFDNYNYEQHLTAAEKAEFIKNFYKDLSWG